MNVTITLRHDLSPKYPIIPDGVDLRTAEDIDLDNSFLGAFTFSIEGIVFSDTSDDNVALLHVVGGFLDLVNIIAQGSKKARYCFDGAVGFISFTYGEAGDGTVTVRSSCTEEAKTVEWRLLKSAILFFASKVILHLKTRFPEIRENEALEECFAVPLRQLGGGEIPWPYNE